MHYCIIVPKKFHKKKPFQNRHASKIPDTLCIIETSWHLLKSPSTLRKKSPTNFKAHQKNRIWHVIFLNLQQLVKIIAGWLSKNSFAVQLGFCSRLKIASEMNESVSKLHFSIHLIHDNYRLDFCNYPHVLCWAWSRVYRLLNWNISYGTTAHNSIHRPYSINNLNRVMG